MQDFEFHTISQLMQTTLQAILITKKHIESSYSTTFTVLTINSIVYGLQYLFLEPNPDDPLNKEAADELRRDRAAFEQNAQRAVRGGTVGGVQFERCLK